MLGNRKGLNVFLQERNTNTMAFEEGHVERAWVERRDYNTERERRQDAFNRCLMRVRMHDRESEERVRERL